MTTPALIPWPAALQIDSGRFRLDINTVLYCTPDIERGVLCFAETLRGVSGLPLPIEPPGEPGASANTIMFQLTEADNALPSEGYRLRITPEQVDLSAADESGMFSGLQTLRQLLPAALESQTGSQTESQDERPDLDWSLPALTIEDQPRFGWRGLMLDSARHLFSVDAIKALLDGMARYKLNRFHWHLTEDQGWRVEIQAYPLLTEFGAYRSETPIPSDRERGDGKPYGGWYSRADVREIVDYAAQLGITVIPELELPGHALAALASYPQLGCRGQGYAVRSRWGIEEDVYCAGRETTFEFLETVLTELFDLFPGEYFHIGGDECPKTRWQTCPDCQARMQAEGLADEDELQSYFIRRIGRFLAKHGRKLLGWDEILEGGLAPGATVMSWRGSQGGIAAAAQGHQVVMSPNTHCYFDYYQAEDTEQEPAAIGGYLPLQRVYQFDPCADIPADQHALVLGGQANVWTEYIQTPAQVDYMVYPRLLALAECLWSPPETRTWDGFVQRLPEHFERLEAAGIGFRTPAADD